ncbi:MAG: GldG family protein [Anaerolineae bacterium]|nr:GldG family protein [Anaerolineae bacterium]
MKLDQRKIARVLFDEYHSEAWSISPEVARQMQPEAPFDSSYAQAAQELARRDFAVARNADSPLTAELLHQADVLIIAHPSERKWERTTNTNSPRLADDEIAAIRDFVRNGGGLIVLGETEQDKYGNNLNDLLAEFGVRVENATVFDYAHYHRVTSWILAQPSTNGVAKTGLLNRVRRACLYRAGVLSVHGDAQPVMFTSDVAQPPHRPVMAAATYGRGRVVVVADSDWVGDEFFGEYDHQQLWLNIIYWAAAPAFERSGETTTTADIAHDANWSALKDAVNTLRQWQSADGALDTTRASLDQVALLVARITAAIVALKPRFPHLSEYLDCVIADLQAWVEGGCKKPDFARSLAAFNPQAIRRDGIEHLVIFPMYTPNGSSDTRFEALLVRVPWPDWLDALERTRYHNGKFVPLILLDHTDGYASECAVLFPETVSVVAKATNNFGGIFCDREAARYRRVIARAAQVLNFTMPPDMAAWIQSPDLVRETYMLWDLIHDTSHSHGELPFDPFMIRQRLPYWMYSLEELRVDLWSFCESVALEKDFPFAHYVQYAILLDRILRFPITGNRVRNYDGLGGQLLFAFLHKQGVVQWRDNTLSVDWDALPVAMGELRTQIDELYRAGIDMTKVQYWIAAHEFISQYVKPNIASKWQKGNRILQDESDPKAWIAQVNDDEFPLSLFYQTLQRKMAA